MDDNAEKLKIIVLSAMSNLKPVYRKILLMKCYEDMDYYEIAKIMNCSELSVRIKYIRAKKAFEKEIEKQYKNKGI